MWHGIPRRVPRQRCEGRGTLLRRQYGFVLLTLLCLQCTPAPFAGATSARDFTPAQQTNTLGMLRALATAIPGLQTTWTGADFCTGWAGVACSNTTMHVAVSVQYRALAGTLPDVPLDVDGAQARLSVISFAGAGGQLGGTLPSSWHQLTELTSVSVALTNVSGTLPASWSSLTELVNVTVAFCAMHGRLPDAWGTMPSLRFVTAPGNYFCGCVPALWRANPLLTVTVKTTLTSGDCATANACPAVSPSSSSSGAARLSSSGEGASTSSSGSGATSGHNSTTTTTTTSSTTTTTTTTSTSSPAPVASAASSSDGSVACIVAHCASCALHSGVRCTVCVGGYRLTDSGTCAAKNSDGAASCLNSAGVAWRVTLAVVMVQLRWG